MGLIINGCPRCGGTLEVYLEYDSQTGASEVSKCLSCTRSFSDTQLFGYGRGIGRKALAKNGNSHNSYNDSKSKP